MQSDSLKLNSEWTFWYASRKEKDHHIPYENRLTEISTFSDLKSFLETYIYLKKINEIPRNADIYYLKEDIYLYGKIVLIQDIYFIDLMKEKKKILIINGKKYYLL